MKSSRHTLLMQPMTSSTPPQLTTESSVQSAMEEDPEFISQLLRRKLTRSAHDEQRRDKHNLRRLVLINNSITSITPCPSPSRTSPGPDGCDDCDGDAASANPIPLHHSAPVPLSGGGAFLYDDDGFGYIFPDLSLYSEDSDDEAEDDDFGSARASVDAESDWLEAVLSDLDDDDYEEPAELISSHGLPHPAPSVSHAPPGPSSTTPIRSFHTTYASGPRYPLPRPELPMQIESLPSTSSSDEMEEDVDLSIAAFDEALPPFFDSDDQASVYSDESSEPSTPYSNSLLRHGLPSHPRFLCHDASGREQEEASGSGQSRTENADDGHIGVVAHFRHSLAQSHSETRGRSAGLGDDTANRSSRAVTGAGAGDDESDDELERDTGAAVYQAQTLLKNMHAQRHQRLEHDYFSCNFYGRF